MKLMDIFVSEKELARREMLNKLSDTLTVLKDYKTEELTSLYRSNPDEALLDKIIATKSVKEKKYQDRQSNEKLQDAQTVAKLLKNMKAAEEAMNNGDISKTSEIANTSFAAFREITKDPKNVNALKAKASLLSKADYNNPTGDHGDRSFSNIKNFAINQAKQAVEGFGILGMAKECEEAMLVHINNTHYDDNGLDGWLEEFEEGKPENAVKGIAAVNIADRMNQKLTVEQSMAVVKRHPNEEFRVKAINNIVDGQRPDRRRSKESFDFLLDHVVTVDGNSTPSKLQALRRLNADYNDYIHPYLATGNEEEPKRFNDVIIDEMHKNAPHVMGQMFNTYSKTHRFLHHPKVSSVIPFNLEGPVIADVRLHFAEQALKEVIIPKYTDKRGNEFDRRNPELYAEVCQDVARLSADVLLDDSLKEGSGPKIQAENNLFKVVELEDLRAQKDQEMVDILLPKNEYYMQQHYQEMLEGNKKHLGEGKKMLDSLEKYGTEEAIAVVDRINQRLSEKKAAPAVEVKQSLQAPGLH